MVGSSMGCGGDASRAPRMISSGHGLLRGLTNAGDAAGRREMGPSSVRMTTTDTLLDFLAPCLAAFRMAHPEITVEVVATNALFTLTKPDADGAIRAAASAPEGLVGRRIATLGMALYAAPDYLARHPDRPDLRAHD
jgi:DNA-binding transcriptional LysR family regulator